MATSDLPTAIRELASAPGADWRSLTIVEDREQGEGGADVGDDQQRLEERSGEHLGVRAGTDDVAGVVEDRVAEEHGRDRGEKGDDEQDAGDECEPSVWVPRAIGLMEGRMNPGPATVQNHDAVLVCLRESGFSFRATVHAYSVMDAYIYGFGLQGRGLPFDAPEVTAQVMERQRRNVPNIDDYPYVIEAATDLAEAGCDYDPDSSSGSTSSWTGSRASGPSLGHAASDSLNRLCGFSGHTSNARVVRPGTVPPRSSLGAGSPLVAPRR
jgi:Tetracyclin repressor-like, C-terminal domain